MFKPSNKQVSVTLISILLLTYYQVKDIAEALYKIKQNKEKKTKKRTEVPTVSSQRETQLYCASAQYC